MIIPATWELVDYWVDIIQADIGTFTVVENVRKDLYALCSAGMEGFYIENTGVFCYLVAPNLMGGKTLVEVIFYIRPEYRGDLRLVKKYIQEAERIAKEKSCVSIKIGGNIRFKDELFLRMLKRWGYIDDTVIKYI